MTRAGYDPSLFARIADADERSFWFRARNRLIVSTVSRHFPNARALLEIGCGTGVVLAALRDAFPQLRLVGGEVYDEGLDVARRRMPDAELLALDAEDLPYEDEFDVVGAFDVLEHLDDDERALAEMLRAARPDGGVVVLVPQHPWLWSEYDRVIEHRRRYTRRALVDKVERAGGRVVEVSSFVTSLLPLLVAARIADRVRRSTDPVAQLDVGPLNGVFERILAGERRLIERGVSLPFGGSLLVVARKH